MKKKIGLSVFSFQHKYDEKKSIELAKKAGADAVDLNLCGENYDYRNTDSIYVKSDEEIYSYFKSVGDYAKEIGIEIAQTHGRIEGFKNITEEDDALIANARLDLLATAAMGCDICVMHSVTTIFLGPDADPDLYRDLNYDMFTKILAFAKKYNVKVATETFGDAARFGCCDFFGNIDEFINSYNRIKATPELGDYYVTCVDTGHSNKAMRFDNPTPGDVIRKLGSSVKVLHLHDNDTLTDQHKVPMTGCIDWEDVLNALDEIGYDGVYNMEVVLECFGEGIEEETAAYAVKVMRNMLDKHYEN